MMQETKNPIPLLIPTALVVSMVVGCTFVEPYVEDFDVIPVALTLQTPGMQAVLPELDASNVPVAGQEPLEPKTGVDISCVVRATNPNAGVAYFESGQCELRIGDTSLSSTPVVFDLSRFEIAAGMGENIALLFPLRLSGQVLSSVQWQQMVAQDSIPYRFSATLPFVLAVESIVAPGLLDTLGIDTASFDFATTTISPRPSPNLVSILSVLIGQLL